MSLRRFVTWIVGIVAVAASFIFGSITFADTDINSEPTVMLDSHIFVPPAGWIPANHQPDALGSWISPANQGNGPSQSITFGRTHFSGSLVEYVEQSNAQLASKGFLVLTSSSATVCGDHSAQLVTADNQDATQVLEIMMTVWNSNVYLATYSRSRDQEELQGAVDSLRSLCGGTINHTAASNLSVVKNLSVAKLCNDQTFATCRKQRIAEIKSGDDTAPRDTAAEFVCVYQMKDYGAAEVLGEALIASGVSLDERTLYRFANALYLRGNSSKALQYAKLGYSRIDNAGKANCSHNVNSCADFRSLLAELDPSYRKRFATEDAQIKARAGAAARQARAEAEAAAREAAATVLDISGSGTHSTEIFSVNDEWELDWSYDCSDYGNTGNFIVSIEGADSDLSVNQLGSGDSGTENYHQGGNIYLKIISECKWTVRAINR